VLTAFDGNLGPDFLQYDVTTWLYIRRDADVLIVGTGGGRTRLRAGVQQRRIVGVEINDQIIEAVNGRFGDFTGHLDRLPNVTFVNDEGAPRARTSASRHHPGPLVDTGGDGPGAFVLTENSLYTVEAGRTS
jgi:hypothetical protein